MDEKLTLNLKIDGKAFPLKFQGAEEEKYRGKSGFHFRARSGNAVKP